MNFEYEVKETNCLQAAADNIDSIVELNPGPSPEILGAKNTPAHDAPRGMEGMAP